MIEILLYHIHIVAALYAFTKRWQLGRVRDGFLAIAVMGLVFVICWSLTGPIARVIMPSSWNSVWFTTDTMSLCLLAIIEAVFFYFYFLKEEEVVVVATP